VETVAFTRMSEGTREDYALLDRYEAEYVRELPDRLLAALDGLKASMPGYQVSRYEHSLQSATRAHRDGRGEEYVAAALLHDIGDELAPYTHGEMVAAILKPYVAEEICWIVKHHGVFQQFHYGHATDDDQHARDAYRDLGKGSGHAAGLDFGDCFAYALATATGQPLLFKGDECRIGRH